MLASRYPNGAVAVSTIGRNVGREYVTEKVAVSISVRPLGHTYRTIWLFQRSDNGVSFSLKTGKHTVFAQDLAGENPVDITSNVVIKDNRLIIPGEVISRVGLMNASEGDCSDPGMVIRVM